MNRAQGMTVYATSNSVTNSRETSYGYGVDDHPSKWPGHRGEPPGLMMYCGLSVKGMEFQPEWEIIQNPKAKVAQGVSQVKYRVPVPVEKIKWIEKRLKAMKVPWSKMCKDLGVSWDSIRHLKDPARGCRPEFLIQVERYVSDAINPS